MAADIHALITARWQAVIETAFSCPIFSAQATPRQSPPYAVFEAVTNNVPMGRGRTMSLVDVRITIYATAERTCEAIVDACGHESKVPKGFHCEEIGTADVRATSIVTGAGLVRTEEEPPFGGGKCYSRVMTLRVRKGAK
jgi:hypothetical protein